MNRKLILAAVVMLLVSIALAAAALPKEQKISASVTSISTDGLKDTKDYSVSFMVFPKNAPAIKVNMWTDKKNYTSGERVFAHINAQFLNKTDRGNMIITLADGFEAINTTPTGPVGYSVQGYQWDVLAGYDQPTPGARL